MTVGKFEPKLRFGGFLGCVHAHCLGECVVDHLHALVRYAPPNYQRLHVVARRDDDVGVAGIEALQVANDLHAPGVPLRLKGVDVRHFPVVADGVFPGKVPDHFQGARLAQQLARDDGRQVGAVDIHHVGMARDAQCRVNERQVAPPHRQLS